MRISSLIVAGCVIFSLYLVIFEREALLAFAAGGAPDSETVGESDDTAATEDDTPAVPVVALWHERVHAAPAHRFFRRLVQEEVQAALGARSSR